MPPNNSVAVNHGKINKAGGIIFEICGVPVVIFTEIQIVKRWLLLDVYLPSTEDIIL
jgi:hypothetical protein